MRRWDGKMNSRIIHELLSFDPENLDSWCVFDVCVWEALKIIDGYIAQMETFNTPVNYVSNIFIYFLSHNKIPHWASLTISTEIQSIQTKHEYQGHG